MEDGGAVFEPDKKGYRYPEKDPDRGEQNMCEKQYG